MPQGCLLLQREKKWEGNHDKGTDRELVYAPSADGSGDDQLALATITEGRVTARSRWPRASKTAPAPQAKPAGSIDHLIELLIEGFCEDGA